MAATPALAEGCQVGPPPHEKGPKVWMDMDQVELDAAYDQSFYAPHDRPIPQALRLDQRDDARAARRAQAIRLWADAGRRPRRLSGAHAERADLRVHSWRRWLRGTAKDYAYPADLFVNAGVNYVALDFIQVDEANGDIRVMADQIRRGIAWVYKNAASFGGDIKRFYIGGHSSGGHLAGVAWSRPTGRRISDCRPT